MSSNAKRRIDAMATYDDRKRRGVCVKCEAPPRSGIIRCQPCADKNAANGRRYFQRKKPHRLAHMQWYRADHMSRGLCAECPRKVKPGSRRCEPCLKKARARYAKRRLAAGFRKPRCVRPKSDTIAMLVTYGVPPERAPEPVCLECGNNPPMRDQAICWCCANPPRTSLTKSPHGRTHVAER